MTHMNHTAYLRRAGAWAARVLLVLFLCGTALFALAQTGAAKRWIARLIESAATVEGGTRVGIVGVEGVVPFSVRIGRVSLTDSLGDYASMEGFSCAWDPRALLRGRIRVTDLSAASVHVLRPPAPPQETPGETDGTVPSPPLSLPPVRVERIAIGELALSEAVLGRPASFTVDGGLTAPSGGAWAARLLITRTDGVVGHARLHGSLDRTARVLGVDVDIEEAAGGIAAGALGLTGPVSISVRGEGPLADWHGTLRASAAGGATVEAGVTIEAEAGVRVSVRGTSVLAPKLLPPGLAEAAGSETRFHASVRTAEHGAIVLDRLSIESATAALTLSGSLNRDRHIADGAFSVRAGDLAPIARAMDIPVTGGMVVEGTFSGPVTAPVIEASIRLAPFGAGTFGAERLEATLGFSPSGPLAGTGTTLRLEARGTVEAPLLDGKALPGGKSPGWTLSAAGPMAGPFDVERFRVEAEHLSAELSGTVRIPERSLRLTAVVESSNLAPVLAGFGVDLPARTGVTVRVSADGRARDLSIGLEGRLTPEAAPPHPVTALLGGPVRFGGSLGLDRNGVFTVSGLSVDAPTARVTGEGTFEPATGRLSCAFHASAPRLEAFSGPARFPMKGSAVVEGAVSGTLLSPEVRLDLSAAGLGLEGIPVSKLTAAYRGKGLTNNHTGTLSFESRAAPGAIRGSTGLVLHGAVLGLTDLHVDGLRSRLTGNLSVNLARGTARGRLTGTVADVGIFAKMAGTAWTGTVDMDARLDDTGGTQGAVVRAGGHGLAGPFGGVGEWELAGNVQDLLSTPRGTLTLAARDATVGDARLVDLSAGVAGTMGEAAFTSRMHGLHRGARFSLDLTASMASEASVRTVTVSRLTSRYGEIPLELTAPARIVLSPGETRVLGVKGALGPGRVEGSILLGGETPKVDLAFERLPLDTLGSAAGVPLSGTGSGHLMLRGNGARTGGTAALKLEGLSWAAPKGPPPAPCDLEITARLDGRAVHASAALTGLADEPVKADAVVPVSLALSPFSVSLPADGAVRATVTGSSDMSRIRPMLPPDLRTLEGHARIALALEGTMAAPRGSCEARITDGTYHAQQNGAELSGLDLHMTARFPHDRAHRDRLGAEITLSGLTEHPLKARLEVPLVLSLVPFTLRVPPAGALGGSFSGATDLTPVPGLAALDRILLGGRAEAAFTLAGTVERPTVAGTGTIVDGAFEHTSTGTVLKGIDVELTAEPPRITIARARAQDGERGVVTAGGWFDCAPKDGFPLNVELSFSETTLLRRDDASVTLAGELTATGSLRDTLVAGRLRVDRAEFRIPDRQAPEITDLQVEELHGPVQEQPPPPDAAPEGPGRLRLDLTVKSSGKVFVSGRGLESEWQGELAVKGPAQAPVLTGTLSVVRGHFNFLGKRFTLTRGKLSFHGASPPAPRLDVVAEAVTRELTATLSITGPVASPTLELGSDPPLPSDEILSRLLFGRAVTSITPIQALQLANAARTLAGRGGPGFLDRTRSVLGVDQLEVRQSGDSLTETTVSAGKYLSDRVYLEVEQGTGAGSGKASVEFQLSPHISVETEVGAHSEGGVGLQWKWDY